ncbi:MAG: hypothetical protein MZV49_13190 [Rhodopseudomonas palustris]|nr:hypothetical protein [Rhodopseudomonas palustris]
MSTKPLEKASQYYNVNPSMLNYKVVAKDQSLFSPLSGEDRDPDQADREEERMRRGRAPGKLKNLHDILNDILQKSKLSAEAVFSGENEYIEMEIKGKDSDLFTEKNARELLDAYQYLINKIAARHTETAVVLECNDYRKQRIRELKDMAQEGGREGQTARETLYLFSHESIREKADSHRTPRTMPMWPPKARVDGFVRRGQGILEETGRARS